MHGHFQGSLHPCTSSLLHTSLGITLLPHFGGSASGPTCLCRPQHFSCRGRPLLGGVSWLVILPLPKPHTAGRELPLMHSHALALSWPFLNHLRPATSWFDSLSTLNIYLYLASSTRGFEEGMHFST